VQFELAAEPLGELRKAPLEFLGPGVLTKRLADREFAVNERERSLVIIAKRRIEAEIRLGGDPQAPAPAVHLIVAGQLAKLGNIQALPPRQEGSQVDPAPDGPLETRRLSASPAGELRCLSGAQFFGGLAHYRNALGPTHCSRPVDSIAPRGRKHRTRFDLYRECNTGLGAFVFTKFCRPKKSGYRCETDAKTAQLQQDVMDIGAANGQNPSIRESDAKLSTMALGPMTTATTDDEYAEFIRRVRDGDEQAAAELVRRYESEIRLEVRTWLRLRDSRLRRVFDSMDICQSVLASFFVRAAIGEFDLDEPRQLVPLLVGMARNKLSERVRHHQRQRRDVRRVEGLAPDDGLARGSEESPSQLVSGRELLQKFRERLTDEERRLAEHRAQGLDWAAIAETLGGTAEARRKQLTRAVARVERELGLGAIVE
jgi:RNA polymerase sigma-70 factor (ECF subfamily)